MDVRLVSVNDINPAKYNPRKITDQELSGLQESLKKFGFVEPLVVNKRTNTLVGGHQRLKASQLLGFTEVPVVHVDLSDAEEKALNVALNSHTIQGKFDLEILPSLLEEIKLELPELYDELNLEGLEVEVTTIDPVEGEDDIPEAPVESTTKPGDIYQLGSHRLMCGDSTMIDSVEKLMNGEKADLTFTSPPYNFGKAGFEEKGKYENNKDADADSWLTLMNDFLTTCMMVSQYQFINLQILAGNKVHIHEWLYNFRSHFVDQFALIKSTLPAMEPNIINSEFECLYIFNSNEFPKRHIKLGKEFRGNISNVFEMKRSSGEFSKVHRAAFDVSFPEYFITTFLKDDGAVIDPFGGTGTTLIACEKTNRKCFMMELDPKYCDVIVARWEKFTGKKAELVNA